MARSSGEDWMGYSGAAQKMTPGRRFDFPRPTALAGSYSPCAIQRIEPSGDLLIVWNQVSGDEMRASYRRGRLSSAISHDDGRTWEHFRCIDTVVLPPHACVAPDPKPQMARGLDYVAVLPDDYGGVSYPTVSVAGDTVFLFWNRNLLKPRPGDVSGRRMRVLPLGWFYGEDAPLPAGPRVILRVPAHDRGNHWNEYTVPSDHYDGRFFVNLRDLAPHLKSPMGRYGVNIYAPLHQVITCLGWAPSYDRDHLEVDDDPHLIATCRHPHGENITATAGWEQTQSLPMIPGSLTAEPLAGIPATLFGTDVGTSKSIHFRLPLDPGEIKQAWLEMEADDIDEPHEAKIACNGTALTITDDVLVAQGSVRGRLDVPTSALRRGDNTVTFTFADNLGGSTGGYDILDAKLILVMK